jgi:hypothetical protein
MDINNMKSMLIHIKLFNSNHIHNFHVISFIAKFE